MASLLIIGGTGFFGKSFLDSFHRGGLALWGIERIVVMARHADRLRDIAPHLLDHRIQLLSADIGTAESLPFADYVIHAAASTDARDYLARPQQEKNNIQAGVYNYCRIASRFHKASKIVYVSSGAVYGVQPLNMRLLEEDWAGSSFDGLPLSKRDYAVAKQDAERAVRKMCEQNSLRASIARCFTFVGPWLPRDQHFAIGNFIQDGLKGKPINVKATSPVYRSYMHADDLVRWLMTMAENVHTDCRTYNVGSDESISLAQVADQVGEAFGVPTLLPDWSGSAVADRYIPSIHKARTQLGLQIEYGFSDALRRTLDAIKGS